MEQMQVGALGLLGTDGREEMGVMVMHLLLRNQSVRVVLRSV